MRLLPWVSMHRELQKERNDHFAAQFLDCGSCLRTIPAQRRARWGCGWLAKEERTALEYPRVDGAPEATVCPGYTIQLPTVLEAARALAWRKDGQLREFYDGEAPTDALRDCMDVLATELQRAEAAYLKARQEDAQKGAHQWR